MGCYRKEQPMKKILWTLRLNIIFLTLIFAGCSAGSYVRGKKNVIGQEFPDLNAIPEITPEQQQCLKNSSEEAYLKERNEMECEKAGLQQTLPDPSSFLKEDADSEEEE